MSTGPERERSLWSEALWWAGLILVTRGLMVAVWFLVLGNDALGGDLPGFITQAREPLTYLLAHERRGNMPPFLGLMLAAAIGPWLGWLPDMVAGRLGLLIWEAIGAVMTLGLLRSAGRGRAARRFALMAWVIAPIGWMTSTVGAQDEVVAAAWVAASLWAWQAGRTRLSALCAGVAVAGGKVLTIVLVGALAVSLPWRAAAVWSAWAALPMVAGYGTAFVMASLGGGALPLVGFRPPIHFGTSIWTALVKWGVVGLDTARLGSMAVCAVTIGGLLGTRAWARWRAAAAGTPPASGEEVHLVWAIAFLLVMLLFYHVNPEYYVLLLPSALLIARGTREVAAVTALLSVPWGVNVMHAVVWRLDHGLDDPISRLWPAGLPAGPLHDASLLICALATATMIAMAIGRLRRISPA